MAETKKDKCDCSGITTEAEGTLRVTYHNHRGKLQMTHAVFIPCADPTPEFKILYVRQAVQDNVPKTADLGFEPYTALITQGLMGWPKIDENTLEQTYGGIPQRRDEPRPNDPQGRTHLEYHLDQVEGALNTFGAPAGFSGHIIWNQELWYPWWFGGQQPPQQYRDESVVYVKANNPGIGDPEALELAEEEFVQSAKEWIVETILKTRALRPDARIGFYAYPSRQWYPEGPTYNPEASAAMDKISDMWPHFDVIAPSVYMLFRDNEFSRDYVDKNVKEGRRVRDRYVPTATVVPYFWQTYGNKIDFLSYSDMELTHDGCLLNRADGLHWFMESSQWDSPEKVDAINDYIDNVMAPIFGVV